MTAHELTQSAGALFETRRRALAERLRQMVERRRAYVLTVAELSALTDRELADLGIARCDIPLIARTRAAEL